MFQVVIYKPCQTTSELVEFAKFDVSKLVAGCDIILDAQVNRFTVHYLIIVVYYFFVVLYFAAVLFCFNESSVNNKSTQYVRIRTLNT
jgi:hypothetical protein